MKTTTMSIFSCFFLLVLIAPSSSTLCSNADKNALLAIKSSFANTNRFASWIPNDTACCNWYGVGCDPSTGRVTSLSIFQDSNLTGKIPSAIGLLTSLQTLTLRKLPKLVGPIPDSFANLTGLTLLDLSMNSLSGKIPLFLSKLTALTYLNLAYNSFSSPIPGSLSSLTNLTSLHLEHNQLYGNIPNTFGNFVESSPPNLYLSHNNLTGLIWPSLGKPNWGTIDISRNRLMGDASVLFGSSKRATKIDISKNRFNFDLSNVSYPLHLKVLDLSHNLIYGNISSQINEMIGLHRFNVSYNRLCGEIPAGSVTARFGRESYMHHMCLCGVPLKPCK